MGFGIEDAFNIGVSMVGYFIRKRKPVITTTIPTTRDLEADVQRLYDSETPKTLLEEKPMPIVSVKEKATSIASGCLPCSLGHLGTCSGLLNEAMRFARKDGIQSEEVINRVNMCMDELNALERVDLRPEMTQDLPQSQKPLADKALNLSRSLRHDLESLSDISTLETVAAKTQATRQEIGKIWFRQRLDGMPPGQRKSIEPALTLEQAKKVAAEEAQREVEKVWNSQEEK